MHVITFELSKQLKNGLSVDSLRAVIEYYRNQHYKDSCPLRDGYWFT
jgi:hypothetical protein